MILEISSDEKQKINEMIARQIAGRGITNPQILEAFRRIPRSHFVPKSLKDEAYADQPLPIGSGQTISQPFIVAYMLDALDLRPTDRFLDIGAGSGYAAALASVIVKEVIAVERIASLASKAQDRIHELNLKNVKVISDDVLNVVAEIGSFDAIQSAAAAPEVPEILKRALTLGGRFVLPIQSMSSGAQKLVRIRREANNVFITDSLIDVRFVPFLRGSETEVNSD